MASEVLVVCIQLQGQQQCTYMFSIDLLELTVYHDLL